MTKEIILQVLNHRLYLHLLLIILAHGMVWFININFGVYLLTKQISMIKLIPFIALGILCTLFGHMVLSNTLFGFLVLAVLCFSIKILTKATVVEAAIISVINFIIIGISTLIFENPLYAIYPYMIDFIMKTPLGIAVGSLFEIVLPLLLLFTIHTLQLQPKLFIRKKITFLDIAGLLLMLDLFYWFYDTSFMVFRNYADHQVFPLHIISQWLGAIASILAFYIFMMYTRKNQARQDEIYAKHLQTYEEQKRVYEEQKSQMQEMINNAILNAKNQEVDQTGVEIFNNLPDYERKVLKLLAEGKMYTEIADIMNVTEGRVRGIVSGLLRKFNVVDKTQLAVFGIKKFGL